jgi:hypothetical protein
VPEAAGLVVEQGTVRTVGPEPCGRSPAKRHRARPWQPPVRHRGCPTYQQLRPAGRLPSRLS